ncbi:MAG: MMPL family transporter [Fluviibacter sp.]
MKKRLSPILAWLAFLVLCLFTVFRASYVSDMSAFLPANPTSNQSVLIEQLTNGSLSRTIVIGIEGANTQDLSSASKATANAMRTSQLFSLVQNGDVETTKADQAFIYKNRYLLSPTTVEHFNGSGLEQSISDSIDLLASPLGMFIKQVFPHDPTGELVSIIKNLNISDRVKVVGGVWMNSTSNRALILAQTSINGTDTENQERAIRFIQAESAKLKSNYGDAVTLKMTGSPVFSVKARETIQSQVLIFSTLGLAAIGILYLWVFRSFRLFALGSLPIITGVLAGIASVSIGFGKVHAITIGFGATLIGEAVDYSIYYFGQAQKPDSDWKRHFWPTIRLGTLTSITGFLALVSSDFPGLAQLSFFTISGLVAAILVTRFVLPCLHSPNLPQSTVIKSIGSWINIKRTTWGGAMYVGYIAALAMAISLALGNGVWTNRISDLSPISKSDKALDLQLRSDLGTNGSRHLMVIKSTTQESALEQTEELSNLLQPFVDDATIAGFDAATKVLPSSRTQILRQEAIPFKDTLDKQLGSALRLLPVKRRTLDPFVKDAENAKSSNLITLESLSGTSLVALVRSLNYQSGQDWISIIPIMDKPDLPLDPQIPRGMIEANPQLNAQYIDLLAESNAMYGQYIHSTITSCLLGAFAIFCILCCFLKSVKSAFLVTKPLVMSVVIVAGTLGLMSIDLTLLHAVGFLLIVAIGSNYALLAFQDGRKLDNETCGSIVVACISTMIGFGVLGFTDVPVLKAVGQTVAPGAFLTLIFSLLATSMAVSDKGQSIR